MPELRDLLEGAVDRPGTLDLGRLGERVARHQRRRRLAVVGVTAAMVVALGVAAVALRGTGGEAGDGGDVTSVPPAGDTTVATTPSPTTTPSTTTASTTTGTGSEATVPGGPGGAPPCAEPGAGQEQASVEHPGRAPLQATETFDTGERWAICGADPVFASDILNLRSVDGGATWSVIDTGLDMTPSHAGDAVEVGFTDPLTATIRLVSPVGERDDVYETTDGGRTWRPVP